MLMCAPSKKNQLTYSQSLLKMRPSPLKVHGIYFVEIDISLPRHEVADPKQISLSTRTDVQKVNEDPICYEVTLTTQFTIEFGITEEEEEKAATRFENQVVVLGRFSVDQAYPSERVDDLVKINGPAVLYSVTRELVSNFTSRSLSEIIVLPSVTFIDAAGGKKNDQKALGQNPKKKGKKSKLSGQGK